MNGLVSTIDIRGHILSGHLPGYYILPGSLNCLVVSSSNLGLPPLSVSYADKRFTSGAKYPARVSERLNIRYRILTCWLQSTAMGSGQVQTGRNPGVVLIMFYLMILARTQIAFVDCCGQVRENHG